MRMPAFGVGVDIENIARFKMLGRSNNAGFLSRVFTDKEIDYCFSKADAAPHLAARFAGKEAVIKSLGSIGKRHPGHNRIEIANKPKGDPIVRLPEGLKGIEVAVSLSHSKDHAIAFAIARKKRHATH